MGSRTTIFTVATLVANVVVSADLDVELKRCMKGLENVTTTAVKGYADHAEPFDQASTAIGEALGGAFANCTEVIGKRRDGDEEEPWSGKEKVCQSLREAMNKTVEANLRRACTMEDTAASDAEQYGGTNQGKDHKDLEATVAQSAGNIVNATRAVFKEAFEQLESDKGARTEAVPNWFGVCEKVNIEKYTPKVSDATFDRHGLCERPRKMVKGTGYRPTAAKAGVKAIPQALPSSYKTNGLGEGYKSKPSPDAKSEGKAQPTMEAPTGSRYQEARSPSAAGSGTTAPQQEPAANTYQARSPYPASSSPTGASQQQGLSTYSPQARRTMRALADPVAAGSTGPSETYVAAPETRNKPNSVMTSPTVNTRTSQTRPYRSSGRRCRRRKNH